MRRLAPKLKVSHQTICNHLQAIGIRFNKRRALKYTDQQLEEIPTRARRLWRLLSNDDFELVMDDEKYFLLHNEYVQTNRDFSASNSRTTPPEIKFKRTKKYEPKILVWLTVSENGISNRSSRNKSKLLLKQHI